jgi:hypothetical protein
MTVEVARATTNDLRIVLRNPRNEMKVEFLEGSEAHFERMLAAGLESWAARIEGDLVALWGVVAESLLEHKAYVWMLGTPAIEHHGLAFARHSVRIINDLHKRFSLVEVHVIPSFRQSIRWIKWLGGRKVGQDIFVIQEKTVELARYEMRRPDGH